ncbi:MAG: protein phosphatase CheZ [Syntrophobacterales bacterium]|nr:protein phosphatase CheZ [Syntrophobacterales bacterium]
MSQERQLELTLEMGAGDFSLRLNGITMNVRLKGDLPLAGAGPAAASPPALPGTSSGESHSLAQEAAFYRQASEEIYAGLGRLAKEIHLSIQDLSLEEVIQSAGTSPGERLDQARHQLNDVLAMTERATLDILDLVEQIRSDCQVVERLLTPQAQSEEPPAPPHDRGQDLVTRVKAAAREFGDYLSTCRPAPVAPEGPAVAVSLADTLQMLLEFCGTEAVKPHLKSLVAQHAALFGVTEAEAALSRLAAQAPVEDGFYQLPVDQVLLALQEHCREARAKELIAKLLASAGKIFPMAAIPLEGSLNPAPASPPEDGPEARWQTFLAELEPLLESVAGQAPEPPLAADRTMAALAATGRIRDSLARITEALSFQDLSGQRLLKVLKILRQVQVLVLTLLIAIGNKLRLKSEGQEITLQEGEALAQEELVRMLGHPDPETANPVHGPETPSQEPLDQEAVNELLASLGF